MESKRNALAELAKRMFAEIDGRRLIEPNREDYDKAMRIIAELAKVSDGHWHDVCNGHLAYCCNSESMAIQCCIGKCREIAEEGAKE